MKTSTKFAALAIVAAGTVITLPAFADDATPESSGCANIRTVTFSRCVHYNEIARDGWASQQAREGKGDSNGRGRSIDEIFPRTIPLSVLKAAAKKTGGSGGGRSTR